MNTKPVSKEEFDKLTPAHRRVEIAKDVIAQLSIERYHASHGNWCILYQQGSFSADHECGDSYRLEADRELQPDINKATCAVCALGAVFASAVGLYDNYQVDGKSAGGQFDFGHVSSLLKGYFDPIALMTIEIAFETGKGWYHWAPEVEIDNLDSGDIADARGGTLYNAAEKKVIDINEVAGLFDRAWYLGRKYDGDGKRLHAIMQNIVDNDGEFKP